MGRPFEEASVRMVLMMGLLRFLAWMITVVQKMRTQSHSHSCSRQNILFVDFLMLQVCRRDDQRTSFWVSNIKIQREPGQQGKLPRTSNVLTAIRS